MDKLFVAFDAQGQPRFASGNEESARNFGKGFRTKDIREYVPASKLSAALEENSRLTVTCDGFRTQITSLESACSGYEGRLSTALTDLGEARALAYEGTPLAALKEAHDEIKALSSRLSRIADLAQYVGDGDGGTECADEIRQLASG